MIGMSWVDLELSNRAGKTYYTVEIPSQMNLLENSTQIKQEIIASSISHVEVRNIQGMIILQTENYEDIDRLSKGLYIVTTTDTNGKVITKKICR